jgi:hypothetical protein
MKHPVTLRIDPELLAASRRCAAVENRTLTNFVETVLKQHIIKARGKWEASAAGHPSRLVRRRPDASGHAANAEAGHNGNS